MKICISSLITLFLMMAVTPFHGFALPSGITGRTLKPGSTPGCAMKGCHTGVEEGLVTIKAPASLRANEVARCTVLVSGVNTGIDISASEGSLAPVSRLLALNGELTHPCPGPGVYVFDYTAPASPGTQTIYATGSSGGTSGPWNFASSAFIYVDLVASVQDVSPPHSFTLGQNFPNPFNPSTQIRFSLAEKAWTTLRIYNLLGQAVATLVEGMMEPGQYTVSFNAKGFPSGVYIYRLRSGEAVETKRMVLLR